MSLARLRGCAGSSDCADVQARLSLRWPHVREVTSHELTRFVKHDEEACKNQLKS